MITAKFANKSGFNEQIKALAIKKEIKKSAAKVELKAEQK